MDTLTKVGLAAGLGAFLFKDSIMQALGIGTTATTAGTTTQGTSTTSGTGTQTTQSSNAPTQTPSPSAPVSTTTPTQSTGALTQLPITQDILTKASWDATTAAIVGNAPAAMLNTDQWNWYRANSGRQQITADLYVGDRGSLITAVEYQRRVAAAQQAGSVSNLSGAYGLKYRRRPAW